MVTGDSWCLESARIEVIDICFAFLTFLFFFLLSFECLRISQSFPIQNKILLVSGFFIYFSRPDHVSFHAGSILSYVLLPSPLVRPPPPLLAVRLPAALQSSPTSRTHRQVHLYPSLSTFSTTSPALPPPLYASYFAEAVLLHFSTGSLKTSSLHA